MKPGDMVRLAARAGSPGLSLWDRSYDESGARSTAGFNRKTIGTIIAPRSIGNGMLRGEKELLILTRGAVGWILARDLEVVT